MPPASSLPPGEHDYESIVDSVRRGRLRFARLRAASGRLNFLIGVSPGQLRALRRELGRLGLGAALYGSRVSGPRLRQRTLAPALRDALPLVSTRRSASATYPGADGLLIHKTAIKELGPGDPATSDLTVMLVAPASRDPDVERAAATLETRLKGLGCTFPIRVFASFEGRRFRRERDFVDFGAAYLEKGLPPRAYPRPELERAFAELYAPLGLPRPAFVRSDVVNGLWNASLASLSFWLALGWHPAVALVGFGFGFFGRYLARFKTWVAQDPADTFLSDSLALLSDAAIGVCVMALVINPSAGFGLRLKTIVWASLLHTLSKGSLRLAMDKHFSKGALSRQRLGVFLTASLNFLQGLATAYVYAGSRAAVALQACMGLVGLSLVFRRPLAGLAAAVRERLEPSQVRAQGMEGAGPAKEGALVAPRHGAKRVSAG